MIEYIRNNYMIQHLSLPTEKETIQKLSAKPNKNSSHDFNKALTWNNKQPGASITENSSRTDSNSSLSAPKR